MSELTLSIPSISLARFVPRGGCGASELLSSLPLAEDPVNSEPYGRFLCEVVDALPGAARRCASMSFLRLAASSLFSSVNLRSRSCGTQSSQLRRSVLARDSQQRRALSGRGETITQHFPTPGMSRRCIVQTGQLVCRQLRSATTRLPGKERIQTLAGRTPAKILSERERALTYSSSPCSEHDTSSHPSYRRNS